MDGRDRSRAMNIAPLSQLELAAIDLVRSIMRERGAYSLSVSPFEISMQGDADAPPPRDEIAHTARGDDHDRYEVRRPHVRFTVVVDRVSA